PIPSCRASARAWVTSFHDAARPAAAACRAARLARALGSAREARGRGEYGAGRLPADELPARRRPAPPERGHERAGADHARLLAVALSHPAARDDGHVLVARLPGDERLHAARHARLLPELPHPR